MNDLQQKFIELSLQKEELISKLKEINSALDPLMLELGEGAMFQSQEGLVYKIQKPKGQFVSFKNIEYVRTKRGDEKKGTLAKSAAKDAGFEVK